MEVFETDHYYIFVKKERSLWWNRKTSEFTTKCGWDLSSVDDIECIGITHGIVGTINLPGVYDPHLVIIKEAVAVGVLYPPHLVYKIKSICLLSDDKPDTILTSCKRHCSNKSSTSASSTSSPKPSRFEGVPIVNKTWGAMKFAGNSIKNTTQQAATLASNQVRSTVNSATTPRADPSRIERKISEELHKIFDDTDSFYYCLESDITNNLQRQVEGSFDERFFWNLHMIRDILKMNDKLWVLPVMQGFVQVEQCVVGNECFTLALVSRRSRHRAGTRYKRRGVDETGNVANYVETEQILSFYEHQISFTQIRGSVPVFWSQPGYKYRPPPRIDRDETETQVAFEKHFENDLKIYQSLCLINLVEQSGKEKVIGDAYANHIVKYNSDKLMYVTFDFHDYCRGMRFENVATLIEALAPQAGAMGFHWRDRNGVICNQKSVFRINCMDCLDRTNVVQTALGKAVLESQLVKLGLAPPYSPLPDQLKVPFMVLWANNGDVISKQYAGTNALKGDYTRTGERKLTGIMKDGMNSANRYYLARFKDSYRQATTDLMLGNNVPAESLNAFGNQAGLDDADITESAEHAKTLVEDCRRLLLGSAQCPVGAWGLIDADPNNGDPTETEVDSILLLTDDCYIVAEYDSHLDKIIRFEKVPLDQITSIEFGTYQQTKIFQTSGTTHLCIRLNYAIAGTDGYFHMFRSPNLRFFNNVAIVIRTAEEITESLNAIIEFFRVAMDNCGKSDVPIICGSVIQRRKSKTPMLDVPKGIPRNLSESQLVQVGSKAFSNVAGQFSKLGQTLKGGKRQEDAKIVKSASSARCEGLSAGKKHDPYSSDSDENDTSIYEPDTSGLVQENPLYTENHFLPSVGIVMSGEPTLDHHKPIHIVKKSSDVCTLSISSVADHVNMPMGMLENASPIRGRSPTPEIRVHHPTKTGKAGNDESTPLSSQQKFSSSTNEVSNNSTESRDLSLNLSGSQSDNTLKQLKTLTSPLSKLAKGMQNFGMNLDPRKIVTRNTSGLSASTSADLATIAGNQSTSGNENNALYEKWSESKCQTKLIAL